MHSKHSRIALASTASASPLIAPKHTMATPAASKATCAAGFIALNNPIAPFIRFLISDLRNLLFEQVEEISVALGLHLRVRYKTQRRAVDAVTHAVGGLRVIGKHVAEMGIASAAAHLGSTHSEAVVLLSGEISLFLPFRDPLEHIAYKIRVKRDGVYARRPACAFWLLKTNGR